MKRSTLFLFVIIGLVLIEVSCNEQEQMEVEYILTGIEDTKWMKYRHSTAPRYRHDSLMLLIQFEVLETIIGVNNTGNYGVYALTIAPNYP